MRFSRSLAGSIIAVVLASVLAGCGSGDDKADALPTLSTGPSESAPPTTPASTTSTTAPAKAVTKYQDLTVELLPPATPVPKASVALERLHRFEGLFASMVAGASTPAELSQLANAVTVKRLNDVLKTQRQAKERGAGQLAIRTTKVTAGAAIVSVDGCFDQTDLVTVRPDGSRYVDRSVKANPTLIIRAVLTNTTGPWRVNEYFLTGGRC